jgi:hypothetical protein
MAILQRVLLRSSYSKVIYLCMVQEGYITDLVVKIISHLKDNFNSWYD